MATPKKPTEPTRNDLIARASGAVAGMPDDLDRLIKRCEVALDAQVSSPTQEQTITNIRDGAEAMRMHVDALIKEGIGLPPKKREGELF